jgi:hypothetical protein
MSKKNTQGIFLIEQILSLKKLAVLDYEKAASLRYEAAGAYRNIALMEMQIDEDSIALVYFG